MRQKRQDPGDLLPMGTVLLTYRLESPQHLRMDGTCLMTLLAFAFRFRGPPQRTPKNIPSNLGEGKAYIEQNKRVGEGSFKKKTFLTLGFLPNTAINPAVRRNKGTS